MIDSTRDIDKFFTIFDLIDCETTRLLGNDITRIMFLYSRTDNSSEFKILNRGVSKEIDSRIISWLKANIDINNMLYGINRGIINVNELEKSVN